MTANGTARPLQDNGVILRNIKEPSLVEIGMQATDANVVAAVFFGDEQVQEESQVNKGTVDVAPKFPEERDIEMEAAAGDEVVIALRETAGGTPSVMTRIKVTPLS
jgi:phage terminase small subunit